MSRISLRRTAGGIPVYLDGTKGVNCGYLVGVRTGSRDEHEGVFGISHLLEHTVFRKTKTMCSFEMAKLMEGAGGALNAFTAKKVTAYFGVTLRETSEVAMRCVGDIVSNPLINKRDTELERAIVLQELSMVKSEPAEYIHSLFEENLWKGDILGMDEGGTEESVEALTYRDLRRYYRERYGRPNLSVYATGAPDPDAVVKWAEGALDPMQAEVVNKRRAPAKTCAGLSVKNNRSGHCQIAFGFPVAGASPKERAANAVLAAALGAGTSSRLFQGVREKNALVYAVNMVHESYSDAGYVAAFMSCTGGNVVRSLEETAKTIRRFRREGLAEGELGRTKNIIKGGIARASERTDGRLYAMCMDDLTHGEVLTAEQKMRGIDAVTEDDVMRTADRLFSPDRLSVTILGKAGADARAYDPSSADLRSRSSRNRPMTCITASSADPSDAATSGVRHSDTVATSPASTATNLTERGMWSGSIRLPILKAVGTLMSCAGTSLATASSKSATS